METLTAISHSALATEVVTEDWAAANVLSLFERVGRDTMTNYRSGNQF